MAPQATQDSTLARGPTRRPPALRAHGLRFVGRRLTDPQATAGPGAGRSYIVLLEVVSSNTHSLSVDPDLSHGVRNVPGLVS